MLLTGTDIGAAALHNEFAKELVLERALLGLHFAFGNRQLKAIGGNRLSGGLTLRIGADVPATERWGPADAELDSACEGAEAGSGRAMIGRAIFFGRFLYGWDVRMPMRVYSVPVRAIPGGFLRLAVRIAAASKKS